VPMAILTGPEHVVAIANERMYELWGKPADVLLHRPIFEGLPEAKNQGYEALLGGVYNTGETFVANELSVMLPRKDGLETVFINLLYEPYREADGSVSGIIAVATDVTAQVLARRRIEELVAERTRELAVSNESLVKVNAELARSNADLQQFAFAASHDLKEPVRKILTFNDRLQTGLGDRLTEKESALLQRLEASAHRMNLLIDDLLTYSQVSLGAVAQEPVNMNAVLEAVLVDLDLEIEQKQAVVTVHSLCGVRGNGRQLQQAFQNLISNALKYTRPDATPVIDVRCAKVSGAEISLPLPADEQPKSFYAITVSDNGIGFDVEFTDKIFNLFTRLHGNAQYSGTGIGLSIVRKVVDNHRGYVVAKGEPGKGAAFTVYLPALDG